MADLQRIRAEIEARLDAAIRERREFAAALESLVRLDAATGSNRADWFVRNAACPFRYPELGLRPR